MNSIFFFIYTLFALLTIIIILTVVISLVKISKVNTDNQDTSNSNGIVELIMLVGCAILLYDIFPSISAMLNALQMQKMELFNSNILKLLLVYEGIIVGGIIISYLCSHAIFKIVKRQFKEPLSAVLSGCFFAVIFIVTTIMVKPIISELINFFQPTIKTPYFR